MAENPIGGSPLDPGASADVGRQVGTVKVNSKAAIDVAAFKNLNKEFKQLNTYVTKFQADLPKLIEGTRKWAAELSKVARNIKATGGAGGAGGSYLPDAGTIVGSNNVTNITKSVTINEAGGGGVGGVGGGIAGTGMSKIDAARAILSGLGAPLSAMDSRIERGAAYSLQADRMSMLYQQMYGMSRGQVYNNFRQPLTSYMLGPTGVNELLGLQAQTGLNAATQARSVEAMRAASGFQYSTSDITGMTRALASPQSTNTMFMMLGTGMYGIGGQQRTQQQVFQDIIRRTGLTNEKAVQGAFQQGSMTRARLEMSGLPADQIDLLLQYAQQNVAFQKKGGTGFYDPSNKAQREFMGVGGNQYATQFEESERTRVKREENFYNRQADNFAAMERLTQSIERLNQSIDNMLASVYGTAIKTKPGRSFLSGALNIGRKVASAGMMIAGGAMMAIPGLGTGAGAALFATGAAIGDPVKMDGKDSGPSNQSGGPSVQGPVPENVRKSQAALSGLNPRFAERLKKMLYANPKLYVNEGLRSSATQKNMFLQRYKPTDKKTDTFWNGTYWEHVKGAPAAPPGMSMHEIGLAADLGPVEEFGWITANSEKFGLRNFANVNNEPWHVQPNDIPGGRSEYERKGSPWGTKGDKFDPSAIIGGVPASSYFGSETGSGATTGGGSASSAATFAYSGLDMSDIVAMGIDKYSGISSSPGSVSAMSVSGTPGEPTTSTPSGKALSGAEVAKLMHKAGFRGEDLKTAVAVAWRESHFNPRAYNPRNKDKSYGLMQINMKGALGPDRVKKFKLNSYDDLYDPATNARVAYELWSGKTSGAGNFPGAGWTPWRGRENISSQDLKNAASYIKEAKVTGDPVMTSGSRDGSVTNVGGASYNITVSPSITINAGAGGGVDIQKVAKDVVSLMEREIRMTMMRVS
jgi:hypothetical protein